MRVFSILLLIGIIVLILREINIIPTAELLLTGIFLELAVIIAILMDRKR